jgi:hypothetical protein
MVVINTRRVRLREIPDIPRHRHRLHPPVREGRDV